MESSSFRSPSVLNDVDTNIQIDVVKRASPLSASKSLKNSSSSSDEMEYVDVYCDQENKPPRSVESASSTESFKFKKPLPRESILSEDNTVNSLIDGFSHLKLGSASAMEKRFNSSKWTTPLKKKPVQPNESRASSDCSFDKNNPSPALNDEETENISVLVSSNQSDKEASISHTDDDCSEYYDCEEVTVIGEQARTSEMSSDNCNTADSSFHSVEKEHTVPSIVENSAFGMNDSKSVSRASLAEMNRTHDSDQAYILDKYLTEQDFKLEISLSDVSFNTMGDSLDFELGKRQSICSQIENPIASSLFSFEKQEKTKMCSIGNQDVNDVTIQPDRFSDVGLFAKENDPENEDALFNLLSDRLIQNETRSMFDVSPEENIFALGRLSQAGFLHIDTVEEENALIQNLALKSPQLQASDLNSNQNDVNELAEVQKVPLQMNAETEIASKNTKHDENVSVHENTFELSSFSCPQQTNFDELTSSVTVTDQSNELEIPNESSSSGAAQTTKDTEIEQTSKFEEKSIANDQPLSFDNLKETNPEPITTIDEIFIEMNKNPKKLNETVEFPGTPSPSSLNATIDTESICDDSFSEKPNISFESKSTRNTEGDIEQSNDQPRLNLTVDLEASQNFILEIGERSSFYQSSNETVTIGDNLGDQSQDTLVNRTVNFNTIKLTQDTHVENSINREIQHDSFDSVTSAVSVINLTEQSQESLANLVTNLEMTDVKIEENSSDYELSNEFVNPEAVSITFKNIAEQCQKSAAVIEENRASTSEDVELSELVNSGSTSIIFDDEISNDQDDAENKRSTSLETSEVTNQKIVNQSQKPTKSHAVEEVAEDITRSNNLNKTVALEIDEKLLNTSFPRVQILSEQNETINSEKPHVINENFANKSDNFYNTEPKIIENSDDIIQEQSYLNKIYEMEVTRKLEETDDFISSDQQNETVSLEETSTTNKISSSKVIPQSSHLNEIADMETIQTFEEKHEDSDQQNETIDLENSTAIEDYSSALVPEFSRLNETVDMEANRTFEVNHKDLDQQNQTIDLESPTTVEVESSALIAESSRLNETFDKEVTQTLETINDISTSLETTTIEVNSSALIRELSHLDETVDVEVTRIIVENPQGFIDSVKQNPTINLSTSTLIENDPSVSIKEPSEFNETVDLKTTSATCEDTIPFSSETVALEYDTNVHKKMGEIAVMPIFSTETILNNSSKRSEIINDDLSNATTSTTIQNEDISKVGMEIDVEEEPVAELSNLPENEPTKEQELMDSSIFNICDDTVIIHESPDRRYNSPGGFDRYAATMPEPASPIPPNSPTELTNKWQTQLDLSSVTDQLQSFAGRDSFSNSCDEMDVTDPVDSNIAPEMLQMSKVPPGINRSISNLESIPEMNETDLHEEQSTSEVNLNQDTKNENPLEAMNCTDAELKPVAILNQTVTSTSSVDRDNDDVLNSLLTITSEEPKLESSIFKTPLTKPLPRSDLSALNDSSFNGDYFCARTASSKSLKFKNSAVSPKCSSVRSSPFIYSPYCTPNRKLGQATPQTSGNILPSLLDMSIGRFENYTANQPESNTLPDNDLNKTVDVDEEPRLRAEETELLCLDDPHKKINVKTQTHDTELSDLRAENAKLKEDLEGFIKMVGVLVHNEAELKKAVLQHEDNNRILNNRYELLKDYSNELLARRNTELDEAEDKIRVLEAQLQNINEKTKASSK